MSTELRELRRSIGGLHKKIDTLNARLVRQTTLCEGCQPDVDRHERILVGSNGDGGGLVERVGSLERARRAVWTAVGGLATIVGSAIAGWVFGK